MNIYEMLSSALSTLALLVAAASFYSALQKDRKEEIEELRKEMQAMHNARSEEVSALREYAHKRLHTHRALLALLHQVPERLAVLEYALKISYQAKHIDFDKIDPEID